MRRETLETFVMCSVTFMSPSGERTIKDDEMTGAADRPG
jgi:hypothetical protein